MITSLDQLDLNRKYTYADYQTWQIKERVELLWGKIVKMAPAPNLKHQEISSALHREFANFVRGKKCKVFHAPFDVRLTTVKDGKEIESVIQPDITVVCDLAKLHDKGCDGAPDLLVEILSPSSATKDLKYKLKLYEEAGVPEYWVVDPHDGVVQVFLLDETGVYQVQRPFTEADVIDSRAVAGFQINLFEIFHDILKEPEEPYGPNVRRIY